ncbi:MAG: N-acetylglucosamine-6-phosphate deacetylase [Daejeonella sp.]|uniref:N-acetylglucosamine-6-phosphate deacetylase n=1 Tax=Daejeonella sp. JGW-45 TaxID=3034148 RepID=UPI0023ED5065|nr:N-acetylglucosamine-6-phosphate deacetylase [Daejeonella sp. JGW-45]
MNNNRLKIHNARIITPYRILENATLLVADGKIVQVTQQQVDFADAVNIDAQGKYVSPGFIDIHVHGGGGHDFMDGSEEAFLKIAETHAKYGTTGLMPTTLTSELDELYHTLDLYKQADRNNHRGAQFLGMHLEGPYFSVKQCGAQDPRYIRNPDPKEYMDILSRSSDIKRWSAAPELAGAIEFGNHLRSKNILVAMAHTDAIYEEALEAFEAGYTLATHFYSCMSGVTRRECFRYAGVIETAYLLDEMDVEIIADGIHLPASLLKLIYKIKGPDRIALITDSMRAAGMPPGESILGSKHNGLKVIVEDGVAKLPDRTSFAGSVATSDRLVRNMVNMANVPLLEAVKMASLTPANILGINDAKGSLIKGKDADIVIFDEDIQVSTTIVQGRVIYSEN